MTQKAKRRPRRIVDPETHRHMIDLYREGYTLRQIAAALNYSYGAVWIHIDRAGIMRSRGLGARKQS